MKTKFTYINITSKSGINHIYNNGYFVKGEDTIFIDAEYCNDNRTSFVIFISEVESIEWYYKTDNVEKEDNNEKEN